MEANENHRTARLRTLANAIPGGIKAIGVRADVSWQTLDQILKGVPLPPKADGTSSPRRLGHAAAAKIEEAFDLGQGWFDSHRAIPAEINPANQALAKMVARDQEVTIPQFETGGAMGFGFTLQDQPGVIRRWVVSPDWIQQNVHRITSPRNLAIVTGFGDSMRPLYNPGDPLLIDRGIDRADIDGIYFFRVGGEGFVKRLQRIPTIDGVILRAKSENAQYDPFDIVKGMDFEVFGRVVKAWRGEEF